MKNANAHGQMTQEKKMRPPPDKDPRKKSPLGASRFPTTSFLRRDTERKNCRRPGHRASAEQRLKMDLRPWLDGLLVGNEPNRIGQRTDLAKNYFHVRVHVLV